VDERGKISITLKRGGQGLLGGVLTRAHLKKRSGQTQGVVPRRKTQEKEEGEENRVDVEENHVFRGVQNTDDAGGTQHTYERRFESQPGGADRPGRRNFSVPSRLRNRGPNHKVTRRKTVWNGPLPTAVDALYLER